MVSELDLSPVKACFEVAWVSVLYARRCAILETHVALGHGSVGLCRLLISLDTAASGSVLWLRQVEAERKRSALAKASV